MCAAGMYGNERVHSVGFTRVRGSWRTFPPPFTPLGLSSSSLTRVLFRNSAHLRPSDSADGALFSFNFSSSLYREKIERAFVSFATFSLPLCIFTRAGTRFLATVDILANRLLKERSLKSYAEERRAVDTKILKGEVRT